jgi:ribosome modulation factor
MTEGGLPIPGMTELPTKDDVDRARWYATGWNAAVAEHSILDNPFKHETPPSSYWIDGWCAFHSEQRQ